jgi:hypothetical protein
MGAEGATTMIVEGPQDEVEKIFNIIKSIKGSGVSGSPRSLVECERGSPGCKEDLACAYRAGLA